MQLTTTTRGDGPRRIALVHGLAADGATWDPFVDALLEVVDATVLVPDLRGHGRSPRARDYRGEAMADDLVDTLPTGLDVVVGHSLGGPVLRAAVARLAPAHAVYLDPGFRLGLPVRGVTGRLFWAVPTITLGAAALLTARGDARVRRTYPARSLALAEEAKARFDRSGTTAIFRDVAEHGMRVAEPPAVPSTVVLTDQHRAVLPDDLAAGLAGAGWDVRRAPGLPHDLQLQDPQRTVELIRDVLVG